MITQNIRAAEQLDEAKAEGGLMGKYLTFHLGGEEYGFAILEVREIIGIMNVTNVPRTPKDVRGVINLRGKIIPVIELRIKFGINPTPDTDHTCIVVVDVERDGEMTQIGVLVDSVSEVVYFTDDEIEAVPSMGSDVNTQYILGIAKRDSQIKILLDINRVLNKTDFKQIDILASQQTDSATS